MSRLTIDITPSRPGEDQAWQELKALLEQRIAEGLEGGVSVKSIDAIVDEELGGNGRAP